MGSFLEQVTKNQTNKQTFKEMKVLLFVCLTILGLVSCAPQYSDPSGDVSVVTQGGVHHGQESHDLDVKVVINEEGHVAPDDYQTSDDLTDKATTTVDQVFDKCSDYADQGYDCVPYYQCHNGTIVTDGNGLIDIRNGFGILSPEDSKCEGFLDVCCLDPDFSAPPPSPIKQYTPKCGQRHQNGLGVRIQGFKEGESQFGEWPHMCAVLSEEAVVEADSGYTQQQQEVDEFRQNPGSLKIRCGEWDTQDQTEPRPHQDRYVTELDIHPAFNDKNLANDWALLYTAQPFELQEHIDTVCLNTKSVKKTAATKG